MIVLDTNVLSETLRPEPDARTLGWLVGQVLSFDTDAADAYAEIASSRKTAGKPISQFDAMIAAIAKSRGASLATRNVKDFVQCGIDVIDPRRKS